MTRGFFFLLFLLTNVSVSANSSLEDKAIKLKLHESKKWINLLHYQGRLFGGLKSQADGAGFFFAKDGKYNPKTELMATIKAFRDTKINEKKNYDNHPLCRFPARRVFLEKNLKHNFAKVQCPKLFDFFRKANAKSISLIFSSYYLNTPASAFGHTLLKLGKTNSHKHELLDNAVNYAAVVTTTNSFLYAVMGMVGGFRGEFAFMPYFYKVREYNDYESRDLWSYDLDLTQDQINELIFHLWELRHTHFDYYYFDENCSYHMLALLDAVNPEWKLTERLSTFVLPVNTIKVVHETPGLVKGFRYRPSKMRIAMESVEILNKKERRLFDKLFNKEIKTLPNEITKESQAKIYDATIEYIDFKHSEDVLLEKSAVSKWKNSLLIERASLGITTKEKKLPYPKNEVPHEGHRSRRFGLSYGHDDLSGKYSNIEYRVALHELIDSVTGQIPNATVEMGNFKFRMYYDREDDILDKFRIYDLALLNITSLAPVKRYFNGASWRFNLSLKEIEDLGCNKCIAPSTSIAGGVAMDVGKAKTYLFVTTDVSFSSKLGDKNTRISVGPEFNFIYRLNNDWSASIFGNYRRHFLTDYKNSHNYGLNSRYEFIKNMALNLKFTNIAKENQLESTLFYYF